MADRLRIMHVIRAKPPGELGGADLHVADLARRQLAANHDVSVVCLGRAEVTGVLRRRAIPHIEVNSTSTLRMVAALRREIRSRAPDVLHSHGYRADLVTAATPLVTRDRRPTVTVMTVHGFISTPLSLRVMTWINERTLRRADIVIAVSPADRDRLTAFLRRPVSFVPNGVEPPSPLPRPAARRRLGLDTPEPYGGVVAFVGRLSPEKRPDLFVELAGIVGRDLPATTFLIAGSGALLPQLRHQAARAPRAQTRFAGLVPDIASLLGAVDVLVCPSDTEGTPRVVLEAMHAGVP